MRKLTNSVGDVLLDLNNTIFNEINYIHKSNLIIVLQDH